MTNPPYLDATRNNISPNENKAMANLEGEADLDQWAKFCLLMVRPRGSVTFIHRSDRLDQILSFFSGKLGNITIYPLWPGKNKPAKRVLIRGIKNTHGTLRLVPGMVLHNDDGRYTMDADRVLRDAAAIPM
jgi:tRNA1(Val) A37 N6-methylase TrmN6